MILESGIPILSSLLIGILLTYLYFKGKLVVLKSMLEQQEIYHKKEIENIKNNELTIITYPYKEEHGEKGLISDSRSVEIGYKYQLFIKGVPCFAPHKIVLNELTKKEVIPSKIDDLLKQAVNAIETISKIHPAIAVAKTAPTVVETIADKIMHN